MAFLSRRAYDINIDNINNPKKMYYLMLNISSFVFGKWSMPYLFY